MNQSGHILLQNIYLEDNVLNIHILLFIYFTKYLIKLIYMYLSFHSLIPCLTSVVQILLAIMSASVNGISQLSCIKLLFNKISVSESFQKINNLVF